MSHRYDPATIEPRWQASWEEQGVFRTPSDRSRPKYYALGMFPYPSGSGLHVGHPESFTALDIVARYKRMNGFNVLHPMGFDSFGLPAERFAVRTGQHPGDFTRRNIDYFRTQLKRLGFSYDWEREVSTCEPAYYRWTQWIFLRLHERGLAYLAEVPVNWCPAMGTVLANEEVQDGRYVETGDPVERRMMKQWMLRITAYADRLLEDLEGLDWPEGVLEMQRQWIGRSQGAEITFAVIGGSGPVFTVFTTRPDTLFGATYCVLAPEHPLVPQVTGAHEREAVQAYVHQARNRSDLDRQVGVEKEKTGVFTGAYATNPVTGAPVPVWVADYVLMSYGAGAIMAVPGHDERDHAFATRYGLPIVEVVSGGGDVVSAAWTGNGTLVNSGFLDGLDVAEAKVRMVAWLEDRGLGRGRTTWKLRDWLFSRQRYWGEPFPLLHTPEGEVVPVAESELPVELPPVDEYRPTADGRPPLARATGWVTVEQDGVRYTRETNTMPQWAGSCWYYLRYMSPGFEGGPVDPADEAYWGPVDLYIGGVEHAVLHLLYARFWHKVLYDLGVVHTKEPFQKLFNQGMILAYSYKDEAGRYYTPEQVEEREGAWVTREGELPLEVQVEKMSKSRLNVVDPLDIVAQYGADALRIYEMFMGPLEQVKPWQTSGVEGVYRFLSRVWRLFVDEESGELRPVIGDHAPSRELDRALHQAIKAVTEGIETLRLNTPVSRMMEFVKVALAEPTLPRTSLEDFLKVLYPYAPHLAEELWARLGHGVTLTYEPWPRWSEAALAEDQVEIAVQVNGKMRGSVRVPPEANREAMLEAARASENVARHLEGMQVVKEVVVPGRLVNIVVRPAG